MPTLEEIEQRVARLETLYEDVLKERLTYISSRLDQLYEKTERDKSEILAKTERDKSEILAKTDKDKRELILWMVGVIIAFLTLNITAIWGILSFALKNN